jgi:hypothetical protein
MTDEAQTLVVGPGEGATMPGPAGGPLTSTARSARTAGRLTVLPCRVGAERADVVGGAPARVLDGITPAGMEPGSQAFRELGAPVGMDVVAPPLGAS